LALTSIKDLSLDELKVQLRKNPLAVSKEYMDQLRPEKRIYAETAIELGYMKVKEAPENASS